VGFSTIAKQAGEQLAPYLDKILPKLFRYQFDPSPRIQLAMSSIWNSLVTDNQKTVGELELTMLLTSAVLSACYEINCMFCVRALHGLKISSPARTEKSLAQPVMLQKNTDPAQPGWILFLGLLLTQTKTQLRSLRIVNSPTVEARVRSGDGVIDSLHLQGRRKGWFGREGEGCGLQRRCM